MPKPDPNKYYQQCPSCLRDLGANIVADTTCPRCHEAIFVRDSMGIKWILNDGSRAAFDEPSKVIA